MPAAALYVTAVQDGDWRPALERFRVLLNSVETALSVAAEGPALLWQTSGRLLTLEARKRYVDYYGRFDPKMKILAGQEPGYLFNDANHFDERFVARDKFYQEFSRAIGTRHTLDMPVLRSAKRQVYLAAMRTRSAGAYDLHAERFFR